MKKKILILAFAAILCCAIFAVGVSAAAHSHPICGDACDCTFGSHTASKTWTAWDGTTTLSSGYYYLTKDVELTKTMILSYTSRTAYLCLNGHTISCADDVVFYSYYSLYICDCKGGGAVKSGGYVAIDNNNKLTLFGGSVIGETDAGIFNAPGKSLYVYGGEIKGVWDGVFDNGDGSDITGNLVVYGGKISAKYDAVNAIQSNLQIHGGVFDGSVDASSPGSTIVTGGVFNGEVLFDGKAAVSGGTFNAGCTFWGPASVSGGTFIGDSMYATGIDVGGGDSMLFLSGSPSVDWISIYGPNTVSAKSADGTASYTGGEIVIYGDPQYLQTGDVAVRDVTAANSSKFVGDPETCALTLSGTNLLYRYTRCENRGHEISSSGKCYYCGAAGGKCGTNAYWGLNSEGTLVISGTGAMYDYLKSEAPWRYKTVNKLVILDGITHIGQCAFENCDKITSVKLPSPATKLTVGMYAFAYCDKLAEIDFGTCPRVDCENKAFYQCAGLVSVTVPPSVVGNGEMFMCCRNLKTAVISCEVLEAFMFEYCDALETVVLSEGVKTINAGVFANGRSLKSVTFPKSLEVITDGIFNSYDGGTGYLERVTFLSDATDIPGNFTNNGRALAADFTVCGPNCSTAARYAQKAGYNFDAADESQHSASVAGDCTANLRCAKCEYVLGAGFGAHSFTEYTDNGDGTETAVCGRDGCTKTDTREKIVDVAVNCAGEIDCTVSGQTVTVKHETACKVGYLSDGKYVAITPVQNGDGSYSFTAPEGVTSVLVTVKGDVNGDGKTNSSDYGRLNAALLGKTTLTPAEEFAADANGDGKVNSSDYGRLNAVLLGKTELAW